MNIWNGNVRMQNEIYKTNNKLSIERMNEQNGFYGNLMQWKSVRQIIISLNCNYQLLNYLRTMVYQLSKCIEIDLMHFGSVVDGLCAWCITRIGRNIPYSTRKWLAIEITKNLGIWIRIFPNRSGIVKIIILIEVRSA